MMLRFAAPCPVCSQGMKPHCGRPDCHYKICDECPLAWDSQLEWASANTKIEHPPFQPPRRK